MITRHDKPVARLIPDGAGRIDDVRRAVSGLRELQAQIRERSGVGFHPGKSVRPLRKADRDGIVRGGCIRGDRLGSPRTVDRVKHCNA